MNRTHRLLEIAKREGRTHQDKAGLHRLTRQWRLEREFTMLEKQVRMLVKLADRSPVVRGKLTNEIVQAFEPGAEHVILERQQINLLLEGVELQVFLLKELLQTPCTSGEPGLNEPSS